MRRIQKEPLIIALLLVATIIGLTTGQTFLPIWGYLSIGSISIIGLVFYLTNLLKIQKQNFDDKFSAIMDALKKNENAIEESINKHDAEIKDLVAESQATITQQFINKSDLAINTINQKADFINDTLNKTRDLLIQKTKEESDALSLKVSNLSEQVSTLQQSMADASENLNEKSIQIIADTRKTKTDIEQLIVHNKDRQETLLSNSTTQVINTLESSKISIAEKLEMVSQANKEQGNTLSSMVEGVSQQATMIHDAVNFVSECLAENTEQTNTAIANINTEIKQQIAGNRAIVESSKVSLSEKLEVVSQANKEQGNTLSSMVEGVSKQANTIQETVHAVFEKNDALETAVTIVGEQVMDQFIQNEDKIIKGIDSIKQDTVSAINNSIKLSEVSFNHTIEEFGNANKKHYAILKQSLDEVNTKHIQRVKSQIDILNKNIDSVQIKTQNIEDAVYDMLDKDNLQILNSLQKVVTELKSELKGAVSDLSNKIIDSKESDNLIIEELMKLDSMMHAIIDSTARNTRTSNVQETPKVSTNSKDQGSNNQTHQVSSTHTVKPTPEVKPNRIEEFVDSETKNKVIIQYKNGVMSKSTMKNPKGHVIYELEYENGTPLRSKNFDKNGKCNVEQIFYPNGQVHYRNELLNGVTKTTEFDINGKKK